MKTITGRLHGAEIAVQLHGAVLSGRIGGVTIGGIIQKPSYRLIEHVVANCYMTDARVASLQIIYSEQTYTDAVDTSTMIAPSFCVTQRGITQDDVSIVSVERDGDDKVTISFNRSVMIGNDDLILNMPLTDDTDGTVIRIESAVANGRSVTITTVENMNEFRPYTLIIPSCGILYLPDNASWRTTGDITVSIEANGPRYSEIVACDADIMGADIVLTQVLYESFSQQAETVYADVDVDDISLELTSVHYIIR